jgi:hypothetical protein
MQWRSDNDIKPGEVLDADKVKKLRRRSDDFLDHIDDKTAAELHNTLAENKTTAKKDRVKYAKKGGGLSRSKDYGSKKKPYPSVKKKDFAGGKRSYPIPTMADAIDALRLAGLHGRADVRAKVFKKYPSLKKK